MRYDAPCKSCDNRHPACHDSCSNYKDFKDMCEAQKEYDLKMHESLTFGPCRKETNWRRASFNYGRKK